MHRRNDYIKLQNDITILVVLTNKTKRVYSRGKTYQDKIYELLGNAYGRKRYNSTPNEQNPQQSVILFFFFWNSAIHPSRRENYSRFYCRVESDDIFIVPLHSPLPTR